MPEPTDFVAILADLRDDAATHAEQLRRTDTLTVEQQLEHLATLFEMVSCVAQGCLSVYGAEE